MARRSGQQIGALAGRPVAVARAVRLVDR